MARPLFGDVGRGVMMWHGDWSGADWVLMSAAMLVFWAAVVAGVIWLVRTFAGDSGRKPGDGAPLDERSERSGRPSAREILDERYARGEMSDEEYRARRAVLTDR